MLSTLHESKIKKDLENERYDTMITQYRKDIREYGNKTHIEYINNYFNPDKIIDKIFSTFFLDSKCFDKIVSFIIPLK